LQQLTETALVGSVTLLQALGEKIRLLRRERGHSQEGFADLCGVHRTYMGTLERGETNISFQNLAKVAETLGITLSQLLKDLEKNAGAKSK
jgi:transcriptional regulator with XRE-family HTH domain